MEKRPQYVKEVEALLAYIDHDDNQMQPPLDTKTPDQGVDMYIEDFEEEERITFIRKRPSGVPIISEDERDIPDLDTKPLAPKPQPEPVTSTTIGVLFLAMFVPLLCIAVQLYFIFNPYTVTVTLYTRSQQEALTGTLQLGRVINPITLSQSATAPTTGKGHQDARSATGSITFYNGQFQPITIPAGTTLTGSDGMQVVTDQDATIPPDNPPVNGQTTVAAHAVNKGIAGNISAGDINTTVAIAVLAKNTQAFYGGQDERNFQTVAPSDITHTAAPLKATLDQSMQDTLTGQLKSGEALTSPSCTTTITADHQAGQEATTVKVTASETCSGIAYNTKALTGKVTQLLTTQAAKKLETGYSLLGTPQITVTSAMIARQVTLSFKSVSTWVYALSNVEQQSLKKLIAGKTTEKALQFLTRLAGIERVSLQSSGFGDISRIPKDISSIHLALFYGL